MRWKQQYEELQSMEMAFGRSFNVFAEKAIYGTIRKCIVCAQMHYEKRSKLKKRLPARVKSPLVIPSEPNTTWSIDFVSDKLQSGRTFRVLNIIDDCDRVAVGQEISMSMPAERVIKLLEKVIWLQGKPKNIRCDNGPEFISKVFQEW